MDELTESRSLIPHSQITTKEKPRDMQIYDLINGAKINNYDFT